MAKVKTLNINFLNVFALTVFAISAIISRYFLLNASRNQSSILLIMLFLGWILIPFTGLFFANKISKRWPVDARAIICWTMIFLAIASVVIYSGVLMPPT